jgi:hypothetical protein
MTFSSCLAFSSSRASVPMSRYASQLRVPRRYQMCTTGAASSIWPMRSLRTLERVTSTPQRSQMMPLNRTRLYLPQ